MNAILTATPGGYLVLEGWEDSCEKDSLKILEGLGFTPTEADEFVQNEKSIEVKLISPCQIRCVQHQDAECIKVPKEAVEYNPLASII